MSGKNSKNGTDEENNSVVGYKCPICEYHSIGQDIVTLHVRGKHKRELIDTFSSVSFILYPIRDFSLSVSARFAYRFRFVAPVVGIALHRDLTLF